MTDISEDKSPVSFCRFLSRTLFIESLFGVTNLATQAHDGVCCTVAGVGGKSVLTYFLNTVNGCEMLTTTIDGVRFGATDAEIELDEDFKAKVVKAHKRAV